MRRTAKTLNLSRLLLFILLLAVTLATVGSTATPVIPTPIAPSRTTVNFQSVDYSGLLAMVMTGLFGGGGVIYYAIKKLVDHRVSQIQQEYTLKAEQLRSGATLAQIDADKIKSLADSIQQMASVVQIAYQAQAQQEIQGLAERRDFRGSLDGNTSTLNGLRDDVHSLYETVNGLTPMLVTIVEALSMPDDELLKLLSAVKTNIGAIHERLHPPQTP